MAAAREQIVGSIVQALTPYLGANMAVASTRGMCQKLGLRAPKLERHEVRELLDALTPGLNVFVGKDRAELVVGEIWRDLDGKDGAP